MAWNNQDPQYSTYGDYNDSQFYAPGAAPQGDASAYDMFEESQNASADPYGGASDPQASYGYYDPNAYQQPSPQPPQQSRVGPSLGVKGHPPQAG